MIGHTHTVVTQLTVIFKYHISTILPVCFTWPFSNMIEYTLTVLPSQTATYSLVTVTPDIIRSVETVNIAPLK